MTFDFAYDYSLPAARIFLDGQEHSSATIRKLNTETGQYEILSDGKIRKRRAQRVQIIWIDRAPEVKP